MGIASFAPRWLAWTVAGSFTLQLLIPFPGFAALPAPSTEALAAAEQQIDRIIDALDLARQKIDRSRFDVDTLAATLGSDVDRIYGFVRDEIGYQAYVGAMRGPLGTLLASSGNAYDKALLLADLLRRAGYETRFAIGRLDADRASQLAHASLEPGRLAPSTDWQIELGAGVLTAAGFEAPEIDAIIEETRASAEAGRAALWQEVEENAKFLEDVLTAAGVQLRPAATAISLSSIAVDHCWVQYKDGGGVWHDLDPTAPGVAAGEVTTTPDSVVAELPEEKVHALTIKIVLRTGETPQGGPETFTDNVLLERKLSIPSVAGKVLRIANVPDLPRDAQNRDLKAATAEIKEFSVVMGVGSEPPVAGFGFTVDGQIFDPTKEKAASPAAPALGGFGGVLGGIANQMQGVPETNTWIVGEWIEYVLASPQASGPPVLHHYRRAIVEPETVTAWSPDGSLVTEANSNDVDALRVALMRDIELMPIVGAIDERLIVARLADMLVANRALLRMIPSIPARDVAQGLDFGQLKDAPVGLIPLIFATSVEARVAEAIAQRFPGAPGYRSVPALISHETVFQPTAQGTVEARRSFDIIHNLHAAGLNPSDADQTQAFGAAMWRGLVETIVERQILENTVGMRAVRPLPVNTSSVFAEALRQGVGTTLLRPDVDGRARLAGLTIPEADKALIAADLDRGYMVVTPTETVAVGEQQMRGWWRVDPSTGTTLGQLSTGRGESEFFILVEQLVATIQAALNWMLYVGRLSVIFSSWLFCVLDSDAADDKARLGAQITDHLACAAAAVVGYLSWIPANPLSADKAAILAMILGGVITTSGKVYFAKGK